MKELRLEVNKACNYECIHCYTDKREHSSLSIEEIQRLFRDAVAGGATDLSLTGGEPLLDVQRVLAIAKEGRSCGMTVRLNTNGHLLTEEVVQSLIPHVDEFQVSLNGADESFFDGFVQRKGAFKQVIQGIKRLIDAKARVTIRFTLMLETASQIVDTFKLCEKLGVQEFKVRIVVPAFPISFVNDPNSISIIKQAATVFFKMIEASKVKVRFNNGGLDIDVPDTSNCTFMNCLCGEDALFIDADGEVAPCPFLREYSNYNLGNVTRTSLSEISSSRILQSFIGNKADGCGNERADGCRATDLCMHGPNLMLKATQ